MLYDLHLHIVYSAPSLSNTLFAFPALLLNCTLFYIVIITIIICAKFYTLSFRDFFAWGSLAPRAEVGRCDIPTKVVPIPRSNQILSS